MTETLDIAVVGAGPCGIAVGAAAARAGVRAALFDKGCITASLVDYPYYMEFFSTAQKLEIGGVPFTIPEPKPTRREALAYYRRVVEHWDIDVRQYQEVLAVEGLEGDFVVHTRKMDGTEEAFGARSVVVATGGFHEPNFLEVPGEELPKVLHYYREPYPFHDQDVLVVGGGNSAVETALELFRNGARVSLVHFLEWIDGGVKPWVVPDIRNRVEKGEIPAYWKHRVKEIRWDSVILRDEETGRTVEIPNDWVLAMTGWRPNPGLLRELGVSIDPETGIPSHDPETMETDTPGVYVAGVLAAGNDANKIFIENGREHGDRIVRALQARVA
ncbi:MAG: YpdA family putative bacillithiol disulfide reductase [Gemmatimonadota bacterium]|jgi:thioredoxin reductase (NADPH)